MAQEEENPLGTGWRFPPTFGNGGGYLEMVSGEEAVEQSMRVITSTQPGERILREAFGCDLAGFLFSELSIQNVTDIENLVRRAIDSHEYRVEVRGVDVTPTETEGVLTLKVTYTIRSSGVAYSMIFPYVMSAL